MLEATKRTLKNLLKIIFPDYYLELSSKRARRHSQKIEERYGCVRITRQLIQHFGPKVQNGPFQGLEFPPITFDRHLAPKLVGSYEKELHPVFEGIISRNYQEILDIGSADGYYAVGLAQLLPDVPVHAFDTDPWARQATTAMARLNGTSNVQEHDKCDPEWLHHYLKPSSFLMSDCEGYEDVLLDSQKAPSLLSCDILVELHETASPGVSERIKNRFSQSHEIISFHTQARDLDNFEMLEFLLSNDRKLAVNELRNGSQQWFFLRRKT